MSIKAFFAYANEREQVRLRKEADLPFPWTDDKILREYKFTNIRRENDRTSQYFIRHDYHPHQDADRREILLNCAIRRYFGTMEFAEAIGWVDYDTFEPELLVAQAEEMKAVGKKVFTGAYVITNGGVSAPKEFVVSHYYIKPLWDAIPELVKIAENGYWKELATAMRKIDGFGGSGFMTKETLVDTTYTNFWSDYPTVRKDTLSIPKDWQTWTPIGPGARRGICRVLGHDDVEGGVAKEIMNNEPLCMKMITTIGEQQGLHWDGDHLSPHDIQFTLCEFDKYERVRLGQGRPRSTYKQR